jgi:PAS domain S-box-containing protein
MPDPFEAASLAMAEAASPSVDELKKQILQLQKQNQALASEINQLRKAQGKQEIPGGEWNSWLFNTSLLAAYVLNPAGAVVRANQKALELLGVEADGCDQLLLIDFFDTDSRQTFEHFLQTLSESPHGKATCCTRLRTPLGFKEVQWEVFDSPGEGHYWIVAAVMPAQTSPLLVGGEQHFRDLFMHHPHPMWLINRDTWAFLEVNNAAVEHYGYSRQEFLAMTALDIRPKEEREKLMNQDAKAHPDFRTRNEYLHRKKDGTLITVEVSSLKWPSSDHQPIRMVLAQDVTESKKAEELIRLRELQLSLLINNTSDFILSVDKDYRIIAFNEPMRQIVRNFQGREIEPGMNLMHIVVPDKRALYMNIYQRVWAGKKIIEIVDYQLPDGQRKYFEESFNPIQGQGDEVVGFTIVSRDITHRQLAEETVRLRESQLSSLINNTGDMIASLNRDCQITAFNEAFRKYFCPVLGNKSPMGMRIQEITRPALIERLQPLYDRVLLGEQFMEVIEVETTDGKRFYEDLFNPIWNGKREVVGFTLFIRDITARKEAQDNLHLRESQISSLINSTSNLMMSVDLNYRILTFNEAFRQFMLTYLNREVEVGNHIFDIIPAGHRQRYHIIGLRVLEGEKLTDLASYRMAGGNDMYFEESFNPIWDKGQVIGFSFSSRDITQQKRAESNLMYRESVFNSIFNESADALLLTTAIDSTILQCNRRALELFAVTSEEALIGKSGHSLHKLMNSDEIRGVDQALRTTGYWNSELEYTTSRGNIFWGSVIIKTIHISGRNYELVRITDITQKKRAEEKVKLYSACLEGILESTQDGIFSLDNYFCYTSFNSKHRSTMKRMYGVDIELGKNAFLSIKATGYDHRKTWKDLCRALKGEQFTTVRAYGPHRIYYEMHLNPIRNEAGEVSGVAVFVRDISERKIAEEKLLTSLREKEVLLSEVYHRVKNNLNVVVSLLTLQANRTNDPSVLEALNESKNRIYSMALVHEQLYRSGDMSRINTRGYIISLAYNIREVYLKQSSAIHVQIDVPPTIHFPLDLAIPMGLILNELLTNSFQHAFEPGQNGQVSVELSNPSENAFQLCVWDNGRGFNPAEARLSAKSLGLKIVEMLVEQIKGKMRIFASPGSGREVLGSSEETYKNRIEINFNYPRN